MENHVQSECNAANDMEFAEIDNNLEYLDSDEIDLNNITMDPEIDELVNSFDIEEYWDQYNKNAIRKSVITNGKIQQNQEIISENFDSFFPNNNVPQAWKWTEVDECIQELRESSLAVKMKDMRGKRKEETNIEELANLCMDIQKYKIESKVEISKGKIEKDMQKIKEQYRAADNKLKRVTRERDILAKICKQINGKNVEMDKDIKRLEQQGEGNRIILKVWKDLNNDKEKEIRLQKEYIMRLENENREMKQKIQKTKNKK